MIAAVVNEMPVTRPVLNCVCCRTFVRHRFMKAMPIVNENGKIIASAEMFACITCGTVRRWGLVGAGRTSLVEREAAAERASDRTAYPTLEVVS